jgi:hypothetical protein
MALTQRTAWPIKAVCRGRCHRKEVAKVTSIPAFEHPSGATLVRLVVAFGFLVVIVTCGVWTTLIHWEIMEKVNSGLPEGEQFKPLWWGPIKRARLDKEYRRLFPDGKDLERGYRLGFIMVGAVVGLVITLRSIL